MKSVQKVIQLLEALEHWPSGSARVSDLARFLGQSKSTCHDILVTLKSARFVEQDEETKRYCLGLRIFELGNTVQARLQIRKVALSHLEKLGKETGETAYLVVLADKQIVYVDCVESQARLRAHPLIGERVPLHCTSLGKAIMAFLPEEEIDQIIETQGLTQFTPNTITDPVILGRELKQIRETGYAIDHAEHEEGICCVGAPIRNHRGEVFAGISVSGPVQRFGSKRIQEMVPLVREAASWISRELGYRPGSVNRNI